MESSEPKTKTYRLLTAALGFVFAASACAIVVVSDRSIEPMLAAAVTGLLGVDAVASAFRNKPSLLSRIGPVP